MRTSKTSSVVVATYNGEKYIKEQLESIISQTKIPDEILIFDDGSTDKTEEIILGFICENGCQDFVKYKKNEKNKGYAKNFLDGALLATGDYIFFCDQDDIWMHDRVEIMLDTIDANDAINLLCTNHSILYSGDNTRKWNNADYGPVKNDGSLDRCYLSEGFYHMKRGGCTMCIRKTFLEEIMPYWIENWAHDDFLWKMAVVSESCAILQYTSMARRMHNNNVTAIKLRTRDWRLQEFRDGELQDAQLLKYMVDKQLNTGVDVLKKHIKSLSYRHKLVSKHRLFIWPILAIKYRDYYPRKKGIYLDLFLSIFSEYRGVN